MASLTFCALQFSSIAFPRIRKTCLSNCVGLLRVSFLMLIDSFPGISLVGLLVGLLIGLQVTFLTLVNRFPGGSLVRLLGELRVYFLTLVDGFRSVSRV